MNIPVDDQETAQERLNLMSLMDEGDYAIPNRRLDENFLIASWNIQNFTDKKSWRTLKYIADIVERFDIVAIQEIRTSLIGISKLQALLPGEYKILISDVTGNYERLAYIYDTRTVEFTGFASELCFGLDTETHEGFQIHRTPYLASFRAGRFDFVLANVHIFEGNDDFREKEIKLLAQHLAASNKDKENKIFDTDFIVLGDFNIQKDGDKFFKALTDNGFSMPPDMDDLKTNTLQTGTYDKLAWATESGVECEGNCNILPFSDAVYQAGGIQEAKKQISDHLPLWVEFKINKLTHYLSQIVNPTIDDD